MRKYLVVDARWGFAMVLRNVVLRPVSSSMHYGRIDRAPWQEHAELAEPSFAATSAIPPVDAHGVARWAKSSRVYEKRSQSQPVSDVRGGSGEHDFSLRDVEAVKYQASALRNVEQHTSGMKSGVLDSHGLETWLAHAPHALPTPTMEKEADRFATEFLMPAADTAHQLTRVTLPLLATLKAVWRVSMAALLQRAKILERVTQRQYVRFRSEFSRCGYLRREPAELDFPAEQPTLLRAIVAFHVQQLGYGVSELADVIHDRPHRVRIAYFGQAGGLQLMG